MEENRHEDRSEIDRQNRIAALIVVLLVALGIWAVNAFTKNIQMEECLEAGHRNCAPLPLDAQR